MMSTEEQILSYVDKLTYDIYTLYQSNPKNQLSLTDFSKDILTQLKTLLLPILEYRDNLLLSTLEQLLLQKMPQYPEPDWPAYYEGAVRQLLSEFGRRPSSNEPDDNRHAPAGETGHVPAGDNRHVPAGEDGYAPADDNRHAHADDNRHAHADDNRHAHADDNRHAHADDAGETPHAEYPNDPVKNTLRRILRLAYPKYPIIEHHPFKNLVFDYFIPHMNLAVEYRPDTAPPNTRQHDKIKLYCRLSGVRYLTVTPAEFTDLEKLLRKLTLKEI